MFKKDQILELKIEKLSFGGNGVAKQDGFVIFVPFSAPGDLLKVRITKARKNFAEGRIEKIIQASSERQIPPCPVFEKCGGCQWQHITYEEQTRQKEMILREQLSKLRQTREITFLPILTGSPWNYRNRIQFRKEEKRTGFFQKDSHEIIDINECKITREPLNEKLRSIKAEAAAKQTEKYEIFLKPNGEIQTAKNEEHGESIGFHQVNPEQNSKMLEAVAGLVAQTKQTQVYDFYCGTGNLSLPLAARDSRKKWLGIEWNKNSIQIAKERAAIDRIENIEFLQGDVLGWLEKNSLAPASLVILDPPRVGCDRKFLELLRAQAPMDIIYVSCNPSTMIRDIQILNADPAFFYEVSSAQVVDMFPQTYHMESICFLHKKSR
jgi:23S rRNA (uracil1939-C5)-methyltransferase